MTLNPGLEESAGSRSLHRLVRILFLYRSRAPRFVISRIASLCSVYNTAPVFLFDAPVDTNSSDPQTRDLVLHIQPTFRRLGLKIVAERNIPSAPNTRRGFGDSVAACGM